MLRQRYRLRRHADLQRVRQHGKSWHHPLAVLLVDANVLDVSRFAFVASRRVGKAVERNRAKRLFREAVRHHLSEIEVGWDCLFIARANAPDATYDEVETAVLQLLTRANLMPAKPGR